MGVMFICLVLTLWQRAPLSLGAQVQPGPAPVITVLSTCCSCELTTTHQFVLLLVLLFIMLRIAHHENV